MYNVGQSKQFHQLGSLACLCPDINFLRSLYSVQPLTVSLFSYSHLVNEEAITVKSENAVELDAKYSHDLCFLVHEYQLHIHVEYKISAFLQ